MNDEATVFVPGHITGFFTVERTDDPATTGSRGGGLTLTDGVRVTVRPAERTTVVLNDASAEVDAVERVLDALGHDATVIAETALPIGAGFGVSGAMALGTALGVNAAFECGFSKNELVTVAHGAEVRAGTGLGDVIAQAQGGMVLRLRAGGPASNELDGIPARPRVEYHTLAGLDTSDVIGGDTDRLSVAGSDALSQLRNEPTADQFMYVSRQFAREANLLTPAVRDVIETVTAAGGEATMAMLGETVFALGTGLSDAGYDPAVCRVDPTGATLQIESDGPVPREFETRDEDDQ
ncbi:MAG: pantoate kinase [Halorhabdus sp.]